MHDVQNAKVVPILLVRVRHWGICVGVALAWGQGVNPFDGVRDGWRYHARGHRIGAEKPQRNGEIRILLIKKMEYRRRMIAGTCFTFEIAFWNMPRRLMRKNTFLHDWDLGVSLARRAVLYPISVG